MTVRIGLMLALAIGLFVGLLAITGVSAGEAARDIANSAFGSDRNISKTVRETVPLLLAGLAVFVALRAGLFNIGVEGQLTVGALAGGVAALAAPGPFGIVLGLVVGFLAGALWAWPAGLIKAYRGGHEVISTIMLNNVAAGLSLALLAGPLRAPGQESTTTSVLTESTRLPNVLSWGRLEVNIVAPVALLAIVAFAIWLKKSVAGYELRLVGENPRAAEFAGVDPKKTTVRAMLFSGGLGGFTGAILVLAYEFRVYGSLSSGYGFDALGVALLAGKSPYAIIPAALLFGTLNKGAGSLQLLGIPKGMTYVLLALLIIVFAAIRYRRLPVRA
jgi:simple sugar transport system permease protein